MTEASDKILQEMTRLFFGETKPKRRVPPPCLKCGRPCKWALRVHPNCANREEAQQLWGEWAANRRKEKENW